MGKWFPVTREEFNVAVESKGSVWKFLGETTKEPGASERKVRVQCGTCSSEHWVFWRHIRCGLSKRCKSCSKMADINKVNERLERAGVMWRMTPIWRSAKHRGAKRGGREFWMKCICPKAKSKWMSYAAIGQLRLSKCRTCASNFTVYKKNEGLNKFEKFYRQKWHFISKDSNNGFKTFENFLKWVKSQPDNEGKRIWRCDFSKPHGPGNSFLRRNHNRKELPTGALVTNFPESVTYDQAK